jgi:hypothetical protein
MGEAIDSRQPSRDFLVRLDAARRYTIGGRVRYETCISFTVYPGKEEGDFDDDVANVQPEVGA